MSSMNNLFDPRVTVFIIWGFFVILFICVPSKRIVMKLFRVMGLTCCLPEEVEEEEERNNQNNQQRLNRRSDEGDYEYLSNARKHEIDSLRTISILRHLSRFSLTLKKEHMAQRLSETQSRNPSIQNAKDDSFNNEETKSELPEPANPEYKDPQCRISMGGEEKQSSIKDLEKGEDSTNMCGIDPPAGKDEEEKNLKYTHVIIPFPGHDVNGNDACNPVESTEESPPKKQTKIRMFGGRNNKVNEELNEAETMKECVEKNTATSKEEKKCKAEVRDVPIFCAICLMEYEISERICWASNPECTHVFHEDCVTQWLISLGRTKSKMQRFSMNPSEKELLNYQLECPCCRQDFIMKSATPEQCGDDAV